VKRRVAERTEAGQEFPKVLQAQVRSVAKSQQCVIADVAGKEQDCQPFHLGREEREMARALHMVNPDILKSWIGSKKSPYQGVVKRDWVPTGRIDFATNLNGNDNPDQPCEFRLLVEERRIVESIAGNENLEIQWRLATLREAKTVVTQYHKYLTENSLVKSVFEPDLLPPLSQDHGAPNSGSKQ
jgi:hypothetical protein